MKLGHVLFLVTLMIAYAGCSSKSAKTEDVTAEHGPVVPDTGETNAAANNNLQTVFFSYDAYNLSKETRKALRENAKWLKENPAVNIQIEGYCDERGTTEYNLALGERRASAVKNYMTKLGIEPARLSTISYGKERPADPGHDEDAWAKNRRAVSNALPAHLSEAK